MNKSSLILLAHGSGNPRWRVPFEDLLADLKRTVGKTPVHLAYMQRTKPNLSKVVRELAAGGTRAIRILPLLLSTGHHALKDIPAQTQALQTEFPGVTINILPPIGAHVRLRSLLRELIMDLL